MGRSLSMRSRFWHTVCSQLTTVVRTSNDLAGDNMEPIKVAARFAAFTCYLNRERNKPHSPKKAAKYAKDNWKNFLPYVDENLGKFLTEPPVSRSNQRSAWVK